MWFVNRPSLDNIYVEHARHFLQSLQTAGKSRKNLNEKEKFQVKQSECEYIMELDELYFGDIMWA